MLVQYLRCSVTKEPYGVIVAVSPDQIGWSLCNRKSGDKFNKIRGREIALQRATKGTKRVPAWQREVFYDAATDDYKVAKINVVEIGINAMKLRACRYFQESTTTC